MKRLTTTLLVVLATVMAWAAAPSASSLVKDAARRLEKARTISADFDVVSSQGVVSGHIWVNANKFRYDTPELISVYNGKTQWTINPVDEELSLYIPTQEEISQINPFAFITSATKTWQTKSATKLGDSFIVEMDARDADATIEHVKLTLDVDSMLPQAFVITLDDGSTIEIIVTNIATAVNIADSTFVVNADDYPDFDLIDLR